MKNVNFRNLFKAVTATAFLFGFMMVSTSTVLANHPVFVEGNCNVPPAGTSTIPGAVGAACGDYDGDGRIGIDEDNDGDRVFGTISGANSAAGVNNNGTITIVTSGTFAEQVILTGNVTLQAAPGVDANIDAVLQGDPGSGARQGQPGIIVNAPANRYVIIRNITSRNWTSGIQVNGVSRVAIESCILEHNINYGIEVTGSARVKIDQSQVIATGFRLNPGTGDFPSAANRPNPGIGIEFGFSARGAVFRTEVSGSFGAGILVESGGFGNNGGFGSKQDVVLQDVYLFDNNPDTSGVRNNGNSSSRSSNR